MPQVQANGMTLEYEIRGVGEPILFVMGLAAQLTDWPEEFLDLFVDRGYQAIRFDNRDIGLSTQTDWTPPSQARSIAAHLLRRPLKGVGYTMPDMADDAAALLSALDIEQAHVVGVSMGGMIAQELAVGHPLQVKSMCSIMSNTGDRKNGGVSPKLIRKFARQAPPSRDTAVDRAVETFSVISGPHFDAETFRTLAEQGVERSYKPDGMARQSAAIAGSRDRTPLLGSVKAPTLVMHGLVDELVRPSGGMATARAIPDSRLLGFGDMGHDLPRPRWGEMCDAIIDNARRAG